MEYERNQRIEGPTGEWERLAPARLTPGGPGSTDVVGWLARGSVVLLALSLVWLVFSAVRPLSMPDDAGAPTIQAARPVEARGISVAEREALLGSVMGTNWFDPNRQMWTHQDIAGNGAGESKEPPKTADKGPAEGGEAPPMSVETGVGLLRTTAPADLPDKLAKAYANLELRGIRMRSDRTLVAMITTVQSPTRPATTPYAIGDSFTDDTFPDEPWQIVFIDGSRDRVYLRRADKTVELPLWKSPSLSVASDGDEGPPTPSGPSREEIVAQLRAAGISEEDIAEVLRMVEEGSDPSEASAQAKAPDVKGLDEALGDLEKESVPEDIKSVSDVLKVMSESETRPRRSNRRQLAFPDVDTYAAAGGGHSIGSIDAEAGVVVLEDGSRWNVTAREAKKIVGWGSAAPVSVYRGRGTSRPYVIVNEFTKDFAEADHVVEAPEVGDGAGVESADADSGSGD